MPHGTSCAQNRRSCEPHESVHRTVIQDRSRARATICDLLRAPTASCAQAVKITFFRRFSAISELPRNPLWMLGFEMTGDASACARARSPRHPYVTLERPPARETSEAVEAWPPSRSPFAISINSSRTESDSRCSTRWCPDWRSACRLRVAVRLSYRATPRKAAGPQPLLEPGPSCDCDTPEFRKLHVLTAEGPSSRGRSIAALGGVKEPWLLGRQSRAATILSVITFVWPLSRLPFQVQFWSAWAGSPPSVSASQR